MPPCLRSLVNHTNQVKIQRLDRVKYCLPTSKTAAAADHKHHPTACRQKNDHAGNKHNISICNLIRNIIFCTTVPNLVVGKTNAWFLLNVLNYNRATVIGVKKIYIYKTLTRIGKFFETLGGGPRIHSPCKGKPSMFYVDNTLDAYVSFRKLLWQNMNSRKVLRFIQ